MSYGKTSTAVIDFIEKFHQHEEAPSAAGAVLIQNKYREFLLKTGKYGWRATGLEEVDCHEFERIRGDGPSRSVADLLTLRPMFHRHHQRSDAPIR